MSDILDLIDMSIYDNTVSGDAMRWAPKGMDPVSRRVYALIFNGLSGALKDFMLLSERARVAAAIYDSLVDGGIEVRLRDGGAG